MLLEPEIRFIPDRAVAALNARYDGANAVDVLRGAANIYGDGLALVSSFGAESAVLLHMVAQIDPAIPILLLETQMLFPETLAYQQELTGLLGLRDVRLIGPDPDATWKRDRFGALHMTNPDACCALRKVEPLDRALSGFEAHVSGRKRFQNGSRAQMDLFEIDAAGRVKVNPLATWQRDDIAAYMDRHDLPRHPLVGRGYPSIGCMPCTSKVEEGEDPRAGRWRGLDKDECGIHFGPDGRVERKIA